MTIMVITVIASAIVVLIIYTIYTIKQTYTIIYEQRQMLKNIKDLKKEIWKLDDIIKEFGQIDSFRTYLEDTSSKLNCPMTKKEFMNFKHEFRRKIQKEYAVLLSSIIFLNPKIKNILKVKYFGIIKV